MTDRRGFLDHCFRLGLGGAGIAAGLGCAAAPRGTSGWDDPELQEQLRVCDRGLRGFREVTAARVALPELGHDPLAEPFGHQERVQIATARSIHMTGWFKQVPEHLQPHPAVQLRMRAALREMEVSVAGNTAFLSRLRPHEIHERAAVLREEPAIATRLQRRMHAGGMLARIPKPLRDRMVEHQRHAWARLTDHDPVAEIADQLATVRRVAANRGELPALERAIAAEPSPRVYAGVDLQTDTERRRRPLVPRRAFAGAARGLLVSSAVMFGLALTATGAAALAAPSIGAAILITGAVLMGLTAIGLFIPGLVLWLRNRRRMRG